MVDYLPLPSNSNRIHMCPWVAGPNFSIILAVHYYEFHIFLPFWGDNHMIGKQWFLLSNIFTVCMFRFLINKPEMTLKQWWCRETTTPTHPHSLPSLGPITDGLVPMLAMIYQLHCTYFIQSVNLVKLWNTFIISDTKYIYIYSKYLLPWLAICMTKRQVITLQHFFPFSQILPK